MSEASELGATASAGHTRVHPGEAARIFARLCPGNDTATAEILDAKELRRHARRLAETQHCAGEPMPNQLLGRVAQDERVLEESRRMLNRAFPAGCDVPAAAARFLNDLWLIKDSLQTARRALPPECVAKLPPLSDSGLPRIYVLAWELVVHTDAESVQETLPHFVSAYQRVAPLTLRELWALPAIMPLALVEYICHAAMRLALHYDAHKQDGHAAQCATVANRGQADDNSLRNAIASLRALQTVDWKEFVENQSAVEHILRADPAGVYAQMDFASRDCYRRAVEMLARCCPRTEEHVAQIAIELAERSAATPADAAASPARRDDQTRGHVGYYMVDRGRSLLEHEIGYRPSAKDVAARWAASAPLAWYLGAVAVVWLAAVGGAAAIMWRLDAAGSVATAVRVALLALYAGAAGQFAMSLVNWLCSIIVPPRTMMRLDFSAGVPAAHRTLVAVPAILSSEQAARELVGQLEVRYLGNQDDNLLFALLTDFPDARQESLSGDDRLLLLVRAEIERLNARHRGRRPCIFYHLHRPRKWNEQQGVWMAEERKRGKLAALNRLVRTGDHDAFSVTVGDLAQLASVRYVITLDTDTQLPRDAGRELVARMAHPLNRPRLDPASRLVRDGYAILQPRVSATIAAARRSRFSRLLAGDAGIDPYTRQISDVYHDLFAEGSFIGKGIYEVEAFEAVLGNRFPQNRILSHDLIEGCYARSGLVNDVQLFEGVPSHVLADLSRRQRWIRGDWQIASWLLPRVPAAQGRVVNPLSRLSRWKIFDNLRRSLTPAFIFGFLALGWILAPAMAECCTLLALAAVFGAAVISALPRFFRKPAEQPWLLHFKDQARACSGTLAVEALSWCMLPHVAYGNIDAAARSLYRVHVSRKKLLEWTTASDAESRAGGGCLHHYRVMWACAAAGLALATWLAVTAPRGLWFAALAWLPWLAGPLIAWRISRPRGASRLTGQQALQTRRWARQTWHYFETFANEENHWLPPDNIQPCARDMTAPRTSPTNIGMGLLADLAACDLGYLPRSLLLDRVSRTLHTLLHLEQFRGHFYNWYDTRTLQPVAPRYVSTVDSGNLWGALSVLRAGLQELPDRSVVPPRLWEGLCDTLQVIESLRPSSAAHDGFDARLAQLHRECSGACGRGARRALGVLARICATAAQLSADVPAGHATLAHWTQVFARQCAATREDLLRLAFWSRIPALASKVHDWASGHRFSGRTNGEGRAGDCCEAIEQLLAAIDRLDHNCSLRQLSEEAQQIANRAARLLAAASPDAIAGADGRADRQHMLRHVQRAAAGAARAAQRQLRRIAVLSDLCHRLCAMDFQFLFHSRRKLLTVGFNVTENRPDDSHYGLLASECRLASFLAISHGQLPPEHWFALGRSMTLAEGQPVLLSWSGTMFEYLMPVLMMPACRGTLLDASCRAAVRRQIRYAREHEIPWGISESCHSLGGANSAYGYRAFGVPGLGLERKSGDSLVVAPYASAMAMMIAPREAHHNLALLERMGCSSPWGFYDAVDYTPQRQSPPAQPVLCRIVMAHHSGMALLGMAHALLGDTMAARFLKDPSCAAHAVLLEERIPDAVRPLQPEMLPAAGLGARIIGSPRALVPEEIAVGDAAAAPKSDERAPSA